MSDYIKVGSAYFFEGTDGYEQDHVDYVKLVDAPKGFEWVRETKSSFTLFEWKNASADEFVAYALDKGPAEQLGKFLVPEFADAIGLTLEHLKKLEPLSKELGEKYQYEKIIYDAYIKNKAFKLTASQKKKAYASYSDSRSEESGTEE